MDTHLMDYVATGNPEQLFESIWRQMCRAPDGNNFSTDLFLHLAREKGYQGELPAGWITRIHARGKLVYDRYVDKFPKFYRPSFANELAVRSMLLKLSKRIRVPISIKYGRREAIRFLPQIIDIEGVNCVDVWLPSLAQGDDFLPLDTFWREGQNIKVRGLGLDKKGLDIGEWLIYEAYRTVTLRRAKWETVLEKKINEEKINRIWLTPSTMSRPVSW